MNRTSEQEITDLRLALDLAIITISGCHILYKDHTLIQRIKEVEGLRDGKPLDVGY